MKGPGMFLAQLTGSERPFIRRHMIRTTDRRLDDFAASGTDKAA
jgi:hypothetical protein